VTADAAAPKTKLILASASPRRLALLQQAGFPAEAVQRPSLCRECRDWG